MVATSDGVVSHPDCVEGKSEVAQRGSHESQGLEEGTSVGLGGLPGGEDLGRGGAWKEEEAVLGRRSRRGESLEGSCLEVGTAGCEVVVLDVWAGGCRIGRKGGGQGGQERWLA